MIKPNTITGWCKHISEWAVEKGFQTPPAIHTPAQKNDTLGKLMLIVTEAGEAAQAVRVGDQANYEEELADIVIRVFQLAGHQRIDLEQRIADKMDANAQRPYRHGKLSTL